MKNTFLVLLTMALLPACAFAVDGQMLINLSTVMAAGGYPYQITQAGSYKLSGPLTAPLNTAAISIQADNVTIDLNGFTVTCSVVLPNAVYCINGSFQHNITIRNGAITGTFAGGSNFGGPINLVGVALFGDRNVMEDLRISLPNSQPPNFGFSYTVSGGAKSTIRHNTLSGGGFITCPSVVVENSQSDGASGGPSNAIIFLGSGCSGYGNVGIGFIP
jgi:hypothetical protein